jgi:hypothetical protein
MGSLSQFYQGHSVLFTVLATFFANYVWSAFVSSLDAPTGDSSPYYRFMFKFLNTLAANLARAKGTSVENSPNWQGAVAKHLAENGPVIPAPKS